MVFFLVSVLFVSFVLWSFFALSLVCLFVLFSINFYLAFCAYVLVYYGTPTLYVCCTLFYTCCPQPVMSRNMSPVKATVQKMVPIGKEYPQSKTYPQQPQREILVWSVQHCPQMKIKKRSERAVPHPIGQKGQLVKRSLGPRSSIPNTGFQVTDPKPQILNPKF